MNISELTIKLANKYNIEGLKLIIADLEYYLEEKEKARIKKFKKKFSII